VRRAAASTIEIFSLQGGISASTLTSLAQYGKMEIYSAFRRNHNKVAGLFYQEPMYIQRVRNIMDELYAKYWKNIEALLLATTTSNRSPFRKDVMLPERVTIYRSFTIAEYWKNGVR
jgi:hypothetical protein